MRIVRAIIKAREIYVDSTIVIDDNPGTSVANTGVWVQAWVWVPNELIKDEAKNDNPG